MVISCLFFSTRCLTERMSSDFHYGQLPPRCHVSTLNSSLKSRLHSYEHILSVPYLHLRIRYSHQICYAWRHKTADSHVLEAARCSKWLLAKFKMTDSHHIWAFYKNINCCCLAICHLICTVCCVHANENVENMSKVLTGSKFNMTRTHTEFCFLIMIMTFIPQLI